VKEESPGSAGTGWFLAGTAGQKEAGKESVTENRLFSTRRAALGIESEKVR